MPLVRRDPPGTAANGAVTPAKRSTDDLGLALGSARDLRVREGLLAELVAVADTRAAAALATHLRSDDAGLRNACIEALQSMPAASASILPALLTDPDPDVRLLATEVVRAQPSEEANALLSGLLDRETHPNVCSAAVEVLAEVGTSEALPALRTARARFGLEAFLPIAIDTVIARIDSGR